MSDNLKNPIAFYPGFEIRVDFESMDYSYGIETFGPKVERRLLDSIRPSLMNPDCSGPEVVYSIAMDVGKLKDREALIQRNLLYGTVLYAEGQLGNEPIRSQGHVHSISMSCQASTPEVYEIWSGKAVIYMQETAKDRCGRCYAIVGLPGDVIIVPPGWAHATISADPNQPLVFGAWCVRDYGFDYKDVRAHGGLAYYPILHDDELEWRHNPAYTPESFVIKKPRHYVEFGIQHSVPIYTQFEADPDRFMFVVNPSKAKKTWDNFIP